MILEIPIHKKCTTNQTISFEDNCLILIGENGSGKSSILESIFNKYSFDDELNVISFSSGQNESFSEIYKNLKSKNKKYIIEADENIINAFYFTPLWSNLLIFFATSFSSNGLVRNFLKEKKLIDEYTSGNQDNPLDVSSRLYFELRINQKYLDLIEKSLEREKNDFDSKSIRKTFLHLYLEKLLKYNDYNEYDFDKTIKKEFFQLNSKDVYNIFVDKDIGKIFSFFSIFEKGNDSLIDISNANLLFKNGTELSMLSDGEFQLLTIYSLIDLFDNKKTIFLFDEVDSHLHYKNINKLWETLNNITGNVLSTTHTADSIIIAEKENIKVVNNGVIDDRILANNILSRLENLSGNKTYQFSIASKFDNIALVENYTDWFVFIELCKIKIDDFDNAFFDKVQYINCSSGYESDYEEFGNNKKKWYLNYQESIIKSQNNIKNLFMICDRDDFPLKNLRQPDSSKGYRLGDFVVVNDQISREGQKIKSINTHLLSWRRKQIENYLISKTMLLKRGILNDINEELATKNHLKESDSMDIEQIQMLEIKDKIKNLYTNQKNIKGICYSTLKEVINDIPKEEISNDIKYMYDFICSKIK